tara:strand:- start:427 stop:612 length:186 start_codon:yes stop_codon:yes gene_type:complete
VEADQLTQVTRAAVQVVAEMLAHQNQRILELLTLEVAVVELVGLLLYVEPPTAGAVLEVLE